MNYNKAGQKAPWYGNGAADFEKCPVADDIDIRQARGRFPMVAESVEEFKKITNLAGVSKNNTTKNYISLMEHEFEQFVCQMRKKFRILNNRISD